MPYAQITAKLGIPPASIGPDRRYLPKATPRPGNRRLINPDATFT